MTAGDKQGRKPLLPVFFCFAVYMLGANMAHPVTPTYIIERGLDSSMFGVAYAAAMFTMFLVAPFWGQLCSYWPTRRITLIAGIGYSIGQLLFLLAHTNGAMIFARLFAGCFSSAGFASVTNYLVNTARDQAERGKNLTIYSTETTVIGAAGFFLGGMLGLNSTETALTAQVVFLLAAGIGLYLTMSDDTPFKPVPAGRMAFKDVNPLAAFGQARYFMNAALFVLLLIYGLAYLGQICLEQVFQYYIKAHFGLPSSYNGTIKAVIALSGLAVNSLITLRIMKKGKLVRSLIPIQILMAIPAILMVVLKSFYPLVACYVFLNLVVIVRTPVLQNLVAGQAKGSYGNTLMGFYQSIGYMGSCLGGLFAGVIYNVNELYPFYIAAVMILLSIPCAVLLRKMNGETKRQQAEQD